MWLKHPMLEEQKCGKRNVLNYLGFCIPCSVIFIYPKDGSKSSKHLDLGMEWSKLWKQKYDKKGNRENSFEAVTTIWVKNMKDLN